MKKLSIKISIAFAMLTLVSCNNNGSSGHTNFDKVEEFAVSETNVNELNAKLQDVAKATAIDNVNVKASVKDTNFHFNSESKTRNEETVEVETAKIDLENINASLEAGVKGLYSSKDKSGLAAYAELKDVSGLFKFSSVDSTGKEVKAGYNLLDNTMEFYHYEAVEYIHLSTGLKNTLFGFLKKVVPDDSSKSITAIEALIPKNGKIALSGIADSMEYPLMEEPGDDFTFEGLDIEQLLELQNTAMENGYELKDLFSFKAQSNKNHYLSIQIKMDKQMLANAKDLVSKVGEENVNLPIDIDVQNTDFDEFGIIIETDANKRVDYASIKISGFESVKEEELTEENNYAPSEYITNTNVNFEASLDYKADVMKRIPNVKELELYTEYDVAEIVKLLMS